MDVHQLATPPSSQDREARADDRASHQRENGLSHGVATDVNESLPATGTATCRPRHPPDSTQGFYSGVDHQPGTTHELGLIDLCTQLEGYYYECDGIEEFYDLVATKLVSPSELGRHPSGAAVKHRVAAVCEERKRILLAGRIPPYLKGRENLDQAIDGWVEIEGRRSMQQAVSDLVSSHRLAFGSEESTLEFVFLPAYRDTLRKNAEYISKKTSKDGKANSVICMRLVRFVEGLFERQPEDPPPLPTSPPGNSSTSSIPPPPAADASAPKEPSGESRALSTRPSVVHKGKAAAVGMKVEAEGQRAQGASPSTDPAPSQASSGRKYAAFDPPFFDGPAVKWHLLFPSGSRTECQEKSTRESSKTRKTSTRPYLHSNGEAKRKTVSDAATPPSSRPATVGTSSASQIKTIPCRPPHVASSDGVAEPRNAGYRANSRSAAAAQAQILKGNRDQPQSSKGKSPAPHAHRKRKLGVLDGAGVIDLTVAPDRKQIKREELAPKRPLGCTASSNQDMSRRRWQLEEPSQLQSMDRRLANLEKLLGLQQ
ncbi:hypothetical protein DL771_008233 [Monosporascus sp. 5C6A]|nr:hypothetical protein DL771_008233 [Monosporascus sp. 5C6A]